MLLNLGQTLDQASSLDVDDFLSSSEIVSKPVRKNGARYKSVTFQEPTVPDKEDGGIESKNNLSDVAVDYNDAEQINELKSAEELLLATKIAQAAKKALELDASVNETYDDSSSYQKKHSSPRTKQNVWQSTESLYPPSDEEQITSKISEEGNESILTVEVKDSNKLVQIHDRDRINFSSSLECSTFEELGLNAALSQHASKYFKIDSPKPIQQKAIPSILSGHDVLIKSPTGTGKTLAFALPIVHSLAELTPKISRTDGIFALVLSPTRELAAQLKLVFDALFFRYVHIVSGLLSGGEKRKAEKARLRKGVNVLVSTPARFLDHLKHTQILKSSLAAGKLKFLVLDEADRLSDKGFGMQVSQAIEEIEEICTAEVMSSCQKIFVSATLNETINLMIQSQLRNPIRIDAEENLISPNSCSKLIGSIETPKFNIPENLKQEYILMKTKDKFVALLAYIISSIGNAKLEDEGAFGIVVFVQCRAEVEFFFELFQHLSWPVDDLFQKMLQFDPTADENGLSELLSELKRRSIYPKSKMFQWMKLHGSLDHAERRKTVAEFSKGFSKKERLENSDVSKIQKQCRVIFCTDVAARGLDIPNIRVVVNYSAPSEVSEYIHRIGRTARNHGTGRSVVFLNNEEEGYIKYLKNVGVEPTKVDLSSLENQALSLAASCRAFLNFSSEQDNAKAKELLHLSIKSYQRSTKSANRKPNLYTKAIFDGEAAADLCQVKMEDTVDENQLQDLAKEAYLGSVRAYTTYEKRIKHFFHPKQLHLGHLAKSLGIRDTPKKITLAAVREETRKRHFEKKEKEEEQRKRHKKLNASNKSTIT